jgi:hypothetical protein
MVVTAQMAKRPLSPIAKAAFVTQASSTPSSANIVFIESMRP